VSYRIASEEGPTLEVTAYDHSTQNEAESGRAKLACSGESADTLSEYAVFNGRLKLKPL
jgi:hypothetical protein